MIELRGMTWDHPRGYQPLIATAPLYAEQYGVSVTWERRSLKDFGDAPIDALAQTYDLLIIDHPHAGLAAATGCIIPLDTCLDSETLATLAEQSAGLSHASYDYDGHQWALAIDAAMQASSYCPDLLDETLPTSWDGVIELGERQQSRGRSIAIPLCPTDAMCSWLTLCASLGDPPGHDDGGLVAPEIGKQALAILTALYRVAHPLSIEWNPIRCYDHMSQHDDIVYCPLAFCYTNYARDGVRPRLLRFHNIPGVTGSILGGTGFAVSSNCAHIAEACAYGAWLCSAEIQQTHYLDHGGQPGNRLAWEDERANELTHHFFRDTLDTLQTCYLRPRHNGFVTFQEKGGDLINNFLRSGSSGDACFDGLVRLYEENLR